MQGQLSEADWERLGQLDPAWGSMTAEQLKTFAAELHQEVSPGHVLYGVHVQFLALCSGSDDVLGYARDLDFPWVSVHLTWRGRENPPWPSTFLHASLEEFCAYQKSEQET